MKSLDPKARFLGTADALNHQELAASKSFQATLEAALAEMVSRQVRPETMERAVASAHELQGARRFIEILLNLAEPASNPPARPTDNLKCQPLKARPPQRQPQRPQPPPPPQ